MRYCKKIVLLVLTLSMLLSMNALAAGATIENIDVETGVDATVKANTTITYEAEAVKFSVDHVGVANGQYLILVLLGDAEIPTVENILYVNQVAADSEGNVSFATVYPKEIDESNIYLASAGLSGLTKIGHIKPAKPKYTPGDVNNDGKINMADVTAIRKYLISSDLYPLTISEAADVNGDGKINMADVTAIRKYLISSDLYPLQ